MKKLSVLIFFLLIIQPVYSWGWPTHIFICKQIYNSNKDLNKMLNKDEFLRGCIAPDKEFKDTRYHHCYVAKQCKNINVSIIDSSGLPYFADIKNCMEDSYFDCPTLEKFEESLEKVISNNFSFYVGAATHYFTDAYVPVHQIMGEDWWKCHLLFEQKIDEKLEKGERFWTVSQKCEIYFPCKKISEINRKCDSGYNVTIFYSYEDIVEIIKKTDLAISERLNITEGNYSYLLEKKPTGFFVLILNKIAKFLNRLFK